MDKGTINKQMGPQCKTDEVKMEGAPASQPQLKKTRNIQCWQYKKQGHTKNFCWWTKCFYCFQYGHIKKNCTYLLMKIVEEKTDTKRQKSIVPDLKQRLEKLSIKTKETRDEVWDGENHLVVYI